MGQYFDSCGQWLSKVCGRIPVWWKAIQKSWWHLVFKVTSSKKIVSKISMSMCYWNLVWPSLGLLFFLLPFFYLIQNSSKIHFLCSWPIVPTNPIHFNLTIAIAIEKNQPKLTVQTKAREIFYHFRLIKNHIYISLATIVFVWQQSNAKNQTIQIKYWAP